MRAVRGFCSVQRDLSRGDGWAPRAITVTARRTDPGTRADLSGGLFAYRIAELPLPGAGWAGSGDTVASGR
eukprot:gene1555-21180_t